MDPLFMAVVEAVEEAVLNAMLTADPMTGKHGRHVAALDHAALLACMAGRAEAGR